MSEDPSQPVPTVAAVAFVLLLSALALAPRVEAAPPTVTATQPPNGAVVSDPATAIRVWFSAEMDNTTVTWTINPGIALTPDWSPNNAVLTLNHTVPFVLMTTYTVEVRGNDTGGNPLAPGPVPNPWVFATSCAPCTIVSTDPADGDANVPLDKDVAVVFSRPPDPGTLTWTVTPTIPFTPVWTDPTTLVFSHGTRFQECTRYTVWVSTADLFPGPVPNPWSFFTGSPRACIAETEPPDRALGVSPSKIIVNFTAPVDHIHVPIYVNITPDPGPVSFAWSIPATTLTTSLLGGISDCTLWEVQVTDPTGPVPSLVPNPWSFRSPCPGPFVARTNPVDGALNVSRSTDITVTFSDPMDPAAVSWTITPAVPLTAAWTTTSVLRLTHTELLSECKKYTVQVSATPLYPGAIPNPWSFHADCPVSYRASPPLNLVATPGNARVVLTWEPPASDGGFPLTGYRVFKGIASGAEVAIADVGLNLTYTDRAVVNGRTYYYQVAAMNAIILGFRAPEVNATSRNLPPVCAVSSPAAGASVSGTVTIAGTAGDPDGAVDRVEVRIDDGLWRTATGNASWTVDWDTTTVANGNHTITARAYDGANYSTLARITVTVDNPPPQNPVTIPVVVWAALLIMAVLALSALFLFLLRRRKREEPEAPPPPG